MTTQPSAMEKQYRSIEELFYDLPKPKQPRPDAAYVRRKRDQLQKLWQPTHDHWDEVDAYIQNRNPLWAQLPDDIRKARLLGVKRSGKAAHLLETVISVFLASNAKVHREPVGEGEDHEAKADTAEEFGQGWLEDADAKEMESVTKTIGKHLALYNYYALEGVTLEPGASERLPATVEEGRAKRMFNPTRLEAPHPKAVLMDPRHTHPKEVVKLLRITKGDLAEMAEQYGNTYHAGEDPFEEVEANEYWSNDWHCLYPDDSDKPIVSERNPFQSPPFVQKFGPRGMVSGDVKDSTWLRWKCVGVLEPVLDLLTQYDEVNSALEHYLSKAAYIKTRTNKEPADAAQEARGDIVTGDKDDWGYIVTPDLPATLFQIVERIERDIEEHTFPKLLGGFKPDGVDTASQNMQLNVAASRKFAPYLAVIGAGMSEMLSRCFRLVITWGHEVTVNGKTLAPSDLEGDDNATVTYPYSDPVLEMEKKNQALVQYKAGVLHFDGYLDEIGVENKTAVKMGLAIDRARQHPALVEYEGDKALEYLGADAIVDDWKRRQQKAQAAQASLVGPRGEPIGGAATNGALGQKPGLLRQPMAPDTAKPPAAGMAANAQMAEGM